MPSYHLILCHPLLLLPSIFPSIRVFSSESVVPIRWPKYWSFSFSFSISPSNPFRMDWLDLLAVQGTLKSFLQHHSSKASFSGTQLSLESNSHICTWLLEKPWLWLDRLLSSKYWSFSFSLSPSNEYSVLISLRIDWFDLLAIQEILKSSPQLKSISSMVPSLFYGQTLTSIHDYW